MKITAQEEYGLRCLLRLARSEGQQSLTIPEIAAAEKLSVPYVGKLLSVLRQTGLIESVRGRAGGYHLARKPEEIRLGSVMLALGEPLFDDPDYCKRHASPEEGGACVHHEDCSLRALWTTLQQWMRVLLERVTLADLLASEEHLVEHLKGCLADAPEPPLLTLGSLSRS